MKVFITGGTSGIGLELAKKYLANGHEVGVCGRNPDKITEPVVGLKVYKADVSNKEQLQGVIEEFAQGNLDLMIANAGISMSSKTKEPDFSDYYGVMDTNINGVLYAFEKALQLMNGKGHLVGMSSLAAYNGLPGAAPYSASKAAVKKLCEGLAIDFHGTGITVSCICPGFIDTPLTKKNRHPMPFLLSLEDGTNHIYNAIENKVVNYAFPFPLSWVVKILEILPRALYKKIMTMKAFNYSH